MGMAAAAWDVLGKAANLAQMSGLHAAMLVAVLTSLMRVYHYHSNKRECARLERCHHRLRALLQWPATGCGGIALLLCSTEMGLMGDPFSTALAEAARLVDSYKESTLWRRLRNGSRMAAQLWGMQDVVDSYCGLLLFVNAHLLLSQDDSGYLWTLLLGFVGGAAAVKYGSVLLPDLTRPNIVQALLMVSLPMVAAVLILLKLSSTDDEE